MFDLILRRGVMGRGSVLQLCSARGIIFCVMSSGRAMLRCARTPVVFQIIFLSKHVGRSKRVKKHRELCGKRVTTKMKECVTLAFTAKKHHG